MKKKSWEKEDVRIKEVNKIRIIKWSSTKWKNLVKLAN